MRVTLIIPPSGFLIDERVFPSLGVLKVAAALEQDGVDVDVIDLSGIQPLESYLEMILMSQNRPDVAVFGITATMPQMPAAFRIAEVLATVRPSARLVLGGPHPTLMQASARGGSPRAIAAMDELKAAFDVVVAGDGEKAIKLAIGHNPPNLIDADNLESDLYMTPTDLDNAVFPARHLINIDSYRYQIDGVKTMSLIAQLGCPFGCVFCGGRRSPFLRKVRTRTTACVLREMELLFTRYGTRGFMFLDDELNVNKKFMELLYGIVQLQKRYGVEFRLRGLLKSELVTDAMAAAMYRAGFRQVLIGFESGHDRILTNIQKNATVAQNTECVRILNRNGIRVKALMSFGHAGDSPETVEATRCWLTQVRPDDFDVTIITVYPGTPYYDDAVETVPGIWTYTAKNGDRLHGNNVDHKKDVNFYKGVPNNYQSFVWTDTLTAQDLVRLRDETEASVRAELGIPFPTAPAAVQYEHSMGQR